MKRLNVSVILLSLLLLLAVSPIAPIKASATQEIHMDVFILYDMRAIQWYQDWGYSGSEIEMQMLVDVDNGLNGLYGQYFPDMYFHVSSSWMKYDWDGYGGAGTKGGAILSPDEWENYLVLWQTENGWPMPDWGNRMQRQHFGMPGTGYAGLHGNHFDYLVMFTAYQDELPGGANGEHKNSMILNPYLNCKPNQWRDQGQRGIWTRIAHESGHGFGLLHGSYDDVMGGAPNLPGSRSLSPQNQADVEKEIHDEVYWYVDDWKAGTDPDGKYVRGSMAKFDFVPPIYFPNGYCVDTIGSSDWSYSFFGYDDDLEDNYYPNDDGEIRGFGWFSLNDRFYEYLKPGRRFLKAYAIKVVGGVPDQVKSSIILDHTAVDEGWYAREWVITGLNPNEQYYIGFGREDWWIYDWYLKAQWHDIAVYNTNVIPNP